MKNAIILHGMPSEKGYYNPAGSNESSMHWLGWLQHQLMIRDIYAATPEVPRSFEPDYTIWKREFERYDISPETILVGHSCGGGFLVRWLSENTNVKVGKVVLVAPWIDVKREYTTDFFEFEIDPKLAERTGGLTVFNSADDDEYIHDTVAKIRSEVPGVQYKEFQGYGHFCFRDMQTNEFPELLAEVLENDI